VFLFHGTPASALGFACFDEPARELVVRAVAVDRPGIGRSTFQRERRLVDWPADVAALADSLEIDTFGVCGWSAGGPYALACAAALDGRVTVVGAIGSPCPLDWPGALDGLLNRDDRRLTLLARRSPLAAQGILSAVVKLTRHAPERARKSFEATLAPSDVTAIESRAELADMSFFVTAFEDGARGVAWDYRLQALPSGFDPAAVEQPVHLWHGTEDRVVAYAHTEALAARLPRGKVHRAEGAGHLLFVERAGEILAALTP
jgi:pimeloyl-ACP methyl ester carboxylesterase